MLAQEQWWVINGADLLRALERVDEGYPPDIIYLELVANSEAENYGPAH